MNGLRKLFHHLFASLGCASENLLLAAQAAGFRGHLTYDASTSSLKVDLDPAPPSGSVLFNAIPSRRCSRTVYDSTDVPAEQLRLLEEVGRGAGVSMVLLTGKQQKEQVAEYVAQGNTAQFGDPRWAEELRTWIRFNARDAVRTGDGPDVPRWLGHLFMRLAFSAKSQNRKDVKNIRSSAGVAVFFSDVDDNGHWIEAGRCYERFALQATALDLRTAFINQPVEVPTLRPQFASWLGIGRRRPDLVVRFGRGPEMPRSLRRPVEQVLV